MAMAFSVAARNGALDAVEVAVGASAILKIRTGAKPADCAAADAGTVLAAATLPSDWMAAASSASKAKSGTWQDASADASGFGRHFRLYANDGTTCHIQGLVSQTWTISTVYATGQQVHNGGNVYLCTTGGTSAGSGGPTGTGTGITDGACVWDYVGTQDMALDNTSITAGQQVTITAFTLTA